MKRRLRFSLLTLLLSVLLIGGATALWLHWEPWVLQASIASESSDVEFAYFSADEKQIVCGNATHVYIHDAISGALKSRESWNLNYRDAYGLGESNLPELHGLLGRRPVVVTMDS